MNNQATVDLRYLNYTELSLIYRRQTGLVVKRMVPKERIIQFIYGQAQPTHDEVSPTTESRRKLQVYIEQNKTWVESQIPCKGENRGKCTIYPCPEGRHLDCWLAAAPHVKAHNL